MKNLIIMALTVLLLASCQSTKTKEIKKEVTESGTNYYEIAYSSHKRKSMYLDIYLPPTEGPHPLIIWFHGGAWRMGDKLDVALGVKRQISRGYAVASVSYSFSQEEIWPTQAHQIKTAIRFLRANASEYDLDEEKFIAWGFSAGAHLANIVGTSGDVEDLEDLGMGYENYSSRVQAVVSWYSPTDFLQMGGWHDNADSPESELMGAPIQTIPEKVQTANPISYVTSDDPPFYIMHGTKDDLVPHDQSVMLFEALQENSVDSYFISLPDYRHGDHRTNTGSRIEGVEAFLDGLFK